MNVKLIFVFMVARSIRARHKKIRIENSDTRFVLEIRYSQKISFSARFQHMSREYFANTNTVVCVRM